MNTISLHSITLATLNNYRDAGQQTARAYRLGGHRLLAALNAGLEKRVDAHTAKLAPRIAHTLLGLRGRVSDAVLKGIDQVGLRAEQAVNLGADGAAKQIDKVAELVAGVGNTSVANGLQAAARLSLPSAKLALAVSGKVADGAKALSGAAQGASAARAVRSATRTLKPKVKAAVKTTVQTTKRRAKRAVAPAAAAAVEAVQTQVVAAKKSATRVKRKLA